MRRVWRQVAIEQQIPMLQVNRPMRLDDVKPETTHILVNWHSRFPTSLMNRSDARFLHLVRDPRDILISGVHYHLVAGLRKERFLAERRAEWDGLNYQDYLRSKPDFVSQALFEMANKHAETVHEMLSWPEELPTAHTVRYEDLRDDRDCSIFRGLLSDFSIADLDIDKAVNAYWQNSLFGGLADADAEPATSTHVRDGTAAQWKRQMPKEVAVTYARQYGDALKRLGYAENDDWVSECL